MVKVTIKGRGHIPQKALLPSAKEYRTLLQRMQDGGGDSFALNIVGSTRKRDRPKRGRIFHY